MQMIYVHVPFCQSRCIYCDFYSTVNGEDIRRRYVDAACREIRLRSAELADHSPLRSIYFGGGTPSLLAANQLDQILKEISRCYDIVPHTEITLEGNPDDVSEERVKQWRTLGINRISLGVQSFQDDTLRMLRRRHDSEQARKAVSMVADGGIRNISIDLMYGLPGQTLEQWKSDLLQAVSLPVTHLSSYALSVEEGTPLSHMLNSGRLKAVDEELYIAEYEALMDITIKHQFKHYEISNFAKDGYISQHNSGYWHEIPYLGIGPGAHSYDGKAVRRYNAPRLLDYISADADVPHEVERLNLRERFNETVFTALRTSDGLDVEGLKQKFPSDWLLDLEQAAQRHIEDGRMQINEEGRLCLTRNGLFVSNDVMSDFMEVED